MKPQKYQKISSNRLKAMKKNDNYGSSLDELINQGKIIVTNASGTWKTNENGIDFMAQRILSKIIHEYIVSGRMPQKVGFFS